MTSGVVAGSEETSEGPKEISDKTDDLDGCVQWHIYRAIAPLAKKKIFSPWKKLEYMVWPPICVRSEH